MQWLVLSFLIGKPGGGWGGGGGLHNFRVDWYPLEEFNEQENMISKGGSLGLWYRLVIMNSRYWFFMKVESAITYELVVTFQNYKQRVPNLTHFLRETATFNRSALIIMS